MFMRDLDVAVPNALDGRRLEVVADGGGHDVHTADMDGAVLTTARRGKERTYPELVGPESRARRQMV